MSRRAGRVRRPKPFEGAECRACSMKGAPTAGGSAPTTPGAKGRSSKANLLGMVRVWAGRTT